MNHFDNINGMIRYARELMRTESELVRTGTWQSVDVSRKPEMATHEVFNFSANAPIPSTIETLQADAMPNLPWAEDHFGERVCGVPVNPGKTWRSWPYALSADKFRDPQGRFNHNYMERYWPKLAGDQLLAAEDPDETGLHECGDWRPSPNVGIRNVYGDLDDVVDLFRRDPLTRQAFVPIFFPEDTGAHHGGRIPCTLGYHFMLRRNQMHVAYFMRSCDLVRHFNDDLYLTARLVQWLLDRLRSANQEVFGPVTPGTISVFISSLHIFRNDWFNLFGNEPYPGSDGHGIAGAQVGRASGSAIKGFSGQQAPRPVPHTGRLATARIAGNDGGNG